MKNIRNKVGAAVAVLVITAANARAAMPSTTDMDTGMTAIGVTAGLAGALGLSIFLYRKAKAKAGQAVG